MHCSHRRVLHRVEGACAAHCQLLVTIHCTRLVSIRHEPLVAGVMLSAGGFLQALQFQEHQRGCLDSQAGHTHTHYQPLVKSLRSFCFLIIVAAGVVNSITCDITAYIHSGLWVFSHLLTLCKFCWPVSVHMFESHIITMTYWSVTGKGNCWQHVDSALAWRKKHILLTGW